MTGDVINLRRARKRRARSVAEAGAAANRATFGIGKAQKALADAARDAANRRLSGHLIAVAPPPDDD